MEPREWETPILEDPLQAALGDVELRSQVFTLRRREAFRSQMGVADRLRLMPLSCDFRLDHCYNSEPRRVQL